MSFGITTARNQAIPCVTHSITAMPSTLQRLRLWQKFGLAFAANLVLQRVLWRATRHFVPSTPLAGSWSDILNLVSTFVGGLVLPVMLFYLCFCTSSEMVGKSPVVRGFSCALAVVGALILSAIAQGVLFGTGR